MSSTNALTLPAIPEWDHGEMSVDPVQGKSIKFVTDSFVVGREKSPLPPGKRFVVIDHTEGWRLLQTGKAPQWLMRGRGEPQPEQPHVPEEEWPMGLGGEPVHPWNYVRYLYLLDADTGVSYTFETTSTGGTMSVGELSRQIVAMRQMRGVPAVPVVELHVIPFKTRFGMKKRPSFEVVGWKLADQEQTPAIADARSLNDAIPF